MSTDFNFSDFAKRYLAETIEILDNLFAIPSNVLTFEAVATACSQSLRNGGKVLLAGNGGSFADSQHLAAEFVSKLVSDRVPLPAMALGTNSSSMSAIANDYGYAQVFSRELLALGQSQDSLIAISTSGNSANVLEAVKVANQIGMKVFGLTGSDGGALAELAECIMVPTRHTAHIQEAHIAIGHMLCFAVEQLFFSTK